MVMKKHQPEAHQKKAQEIEMQLRQQLSSDASSIKKKSIVEDSEDWLVTYADAITLILAFFVLLFSVSEINQQKFEAINQSIDDKFLQKKPEQKVNPLLDLQGRLGVLLNNYGVNPDKALQLNENSLKVALPGELLFGSGSAEVGVESRKLIEELAQQMNAFDLPNYQIEIEGHTDDVPIQTLKFPSNWELSSARAISVLKVFMELKATKHQLKAIGYADTIPIAPNRDELGNAIEKNQRLNRRVEIKLTRVFGY